MNNLVCTLVSFLGKKWLRWNLKRIFRTTAQISKSEYHTVDIISIDFLSQCLFYFYSKLSMSMAHENTNHYVNFHLLKAIHFSHSTTTSLNISQNEWPRGYGHRSKRNEDYRYAMQVLSKPISTFFLPCYHLSLICHFFPTIVLI